jgi:hypothetical protein
VVGVRGEGWGGGLFIGGQRGRGWVRAVTAANGGARVVALAYGRARADVWAVLESDVAGLASAAREGGAREERGRAGGLPRGRSSPGVARVSGQELGCPFWGLVEEERGVQVVPWAGRVRVQRGDHGRRSGPARRGDRVVHGQCTAGVLSDGSVVPDSVVQRSSCVYGAGWVGLGACRMWCSRLARLRGTGFGKG